MASHIQHCAHFNHISIKGSPVYPWVPSQKNNSNSEVCIRVQLKPTAHRTPLGYRVGEILFASPIKQKPCTEIPPGCDFVSLDKEHSKSKPLSQHKTIHRGIGECKFLCDCVPTQHSSASWGISRFMSAGLKSEKINQRAWNEEVFSKLDR